MSETDRNGFKIWEKVCASRLLETDAVEDTKKVAVSLQEYIAKPIFRSRAWVLDKIDF